MARLLSHRCATSGPGGDNWRLSRPTCALLLAALLLLFGARADAQGVPRTLHYGVIAGPSLPTGAFAEDFDPGRHAGALFGLRRPEWPFGMRLEAVYHLNDVKNADFHERLWVLTGNVEYRFRGDATLVPYAIGGAGWVFGKLVDDRADFDAGSEAAMSWNLGGGVAFPVASFELIVEARYHVIELDGQPMHLLPVSVGFVF